MADIKLPYEEAAMTIAHSRAQEFRERHGNDPARIYEYIGWIIGEALHDGIELGLEFSLHMESPALFESTDAWLEGYSQAIKDIKSLGDKK